MFFRKKKESRSASGINAAMLGEHFASIRTTAVEIRDFREKLIRPTPTQHVLKQVNLDEAWESSRELFIEIFSILNDVADCFGITKGGFFRNGGFSSALNAFINTLDTITYGIADALGTGLYPPEKLQAIDARILQVQTGMNRLRKHVMEDFTYQRSPARPAESPAKPPEEHRELKIIPTDSVLGKLG